MPRILYFGCRGVPGHFLYSEHGSRLYDVLTPWGVWLNLDGKLAPTGTGVYQPDDVAALHVRGGWAALAFWDRSGDGRGNSNSAFFVEGASTAEDVVAAAEATFPDVVKRLRVWPLPVVVEVLDG